MTWLAICGAEFPEVVGKIIDEQKTDASIDFMVYTGATPEDMQAATMANMDVKVWTAPKPGGSAPAAGGTQAATPIPPQPDVVRLSKDDGIRFSGTLVSYDPSPFLLHWDQVKVDPTVIPEAPARARASPRRRDNPEAVELLQFSLGQMAGPETGRPFFWRWSPARFGFVAAFTAQFMYR